MHQLLASIQIFPHWVGSSILLNSYHTVPLQQSMKWGRGDVGVTIWLVGWSVSQLTGWFVSRRLWRETTGIDDLHLTLGRHDPYQM